MNFVFLGILNPSIIQVIDTYYNIMCVLKYSSTCNNKREISLV